jgi:hypothetical protein
MSGSVEELEAETAQARAELARTVDALTQRVESGARVAGKVALAAGVAVAGVAVAAVVLIRRRRRD